MKSFWISCAVCLCVLGTGCGSTSGSIVGKVVVDGAPIGGQQVLLQGVQTSSTVKTGSDGVYRFDGVASGTYLLSVSVASTEERSRQVVVKGPATVPDLSFTGEGTVTGKVVDDDGDAVADTQVRMLGTSASSTTDASGSFTFEGAPTGSHTLSATTPEGAGQAKVTVAFGATQNVTVVLKSTLPVPGTVSGQVGFVAPGRDLTAVRISVPALGVSAQAAADGTYSLALPPGEWDVFAKTDLYPSQKIGKVSVLSGQTATLPLYTLSLYTRLPDLWPGIVWSGEDASRLGHRSVVLLGALFQGGSGKAYYALDLASKRPRLLAVADASLPPPVLSADGKWAAMTSDDAIVIEALDTSEHFTVPLPAAASQITFSSTSSVVHFTADAVFYQVDLASGAVTRIPYFNDWTHQIVIAPDRILLQTASTAPATWKLVTPDGVTTAFTNASVVLPAWAGGLLDPQNEVAVESCGNAQCPVDVLATDATTALPVTVAGSPLQAVAPNLSVLDEGTAGTWITLDVSGALYVVDAETGKGVALPAGVSTAQISPDGARYIYDEPTPEGHAFHEHALPLPESPTAPLLTSGDVLNGTWLSSTHFIGFDENPTIGTPYRFTIDSGVLTQDANYQPTSGNESGGCVSWAGTDGVGYLQSGNSVVLKAPSGVTAAPIACPPELKIDSTSGVPVLDYGQHAAAQWNHSEIWLYTEQGQARAVDIPNVSISGIVNGQVVVQVGSMPWAVDLDTLEPLPLVEPELDGSSFTADASLADMSTVLVAPLSSPTGEPEGGEWAFVPFFL